MNLKSTPGHEEPPLPPALTNIGSPAGSPRNRISAEAWIGLGILVLTLVAYLQVMGFEFVSFDDPVYVTGNPTILGGLSWKSLRYAFSTGDDGSYLPLVWLSHAASVSLFGTWAGGHHLVNLLLHAANSLLLFLFLNRITKALRPSAIAAILFALHPLHVESVAWVSERKDVLSTLFWILTSWAYVRYAERPSVRRYLGMAFLFILGLLSKSMLVTLPLTLLLLDAWPLNRINLEGTWDAARASAVWALVREKIPLLALSVVAGLATIRIQKGVGAMVTLGMVPVQLRLGNAAMTLTEYLRQTVWPFNLTFFYPFPEQLPAWKVAGSLALVFAISVVVLLKARRRPFLAVGWFWYLITLAPVVGILQVGSQAHADRYTYVPLIGIFLVLGWVADELILRSELSRSALLATVGSFLGLLLLLGTVQVSRWRDNATLFRHALSINPDNPVALGGLGDEFMKIGRFQDAYQIYFNAMQLRPNMEVKVGFALEKMGRPEQALKYYQLAKKAQPGAYGPDQKIGHVLLSSGRFTEAEPYILRVNQNPGLAWSHADPWVDVQGARIDWAALLRNQNRLPEAIQVLESLVALDPTSVQARVDLGLTYSQAGHLEEALPHLEKALELSPTDPQVIYWRGVTLTKLNRFGEARSTFERLKEVDPQSPRFQKGMAELERAQAKAR